LNRRVGALLLLAGLAAAAPVTAQQRAVDLTRSRRVVFHSKAPIEDFEGVTDRIDGYVAWGSGALSPGAAYQGSEFYFEVDLNALDTGLGLRNRHMRQNYLETKLYPYATYKGAIRNATAGRGDTLLVAVSGTFTIHGVERPLSVACPVVPEGQGGYRVRCRFQVRLSDFRIKIPSLMVMKLNEVVDLTLDFAVTRPEQ
jgi:polyisoprenoid-binding protein YceI